MDAKNLLEPVLAMVVLHAVVWVWMTITRGMAMSRVGMSLEQGRHTADLQQLPDPSRQVADNYNHLFELPTVFYALVFYPAFSLFTQFGDWQQIYAPLIGRSAASRFPWRAQLLPRRSSVSAGAAAAAAAASTSPSAPDSAACSKAST